MLGLYGINSFNSLGDIYPLSVRFYVTFVLSLNEVVPLLTLSALDTIRALFDSDKDDINKMDIKMKYIVSLIRHV